MNTEKNLAEAFAGESQANRKYLAYAQQADNEGYHQVAKLFRAAAHAETIHALAHFKAMGKIKSTKENLQDAIAGETYEFTKMYPEFLEVARQENAKVAIRNFTLANEAEKVHAELYQKAYANLDSMQTQSIYVCSICGHITEGNVPDICPICGAKAVAFKEID